MSTRERLQETFKFALAMTLAYWLALALNWDLPKYAGLAIVLISLDSTGASLNKGLARVVGTVASVLVAWVLIGTLFDDRWAFMAAMAAYLAFCAYCMQRSRVPYGWYVAGFVAFVVWSSSYHDPGNAFHFGVFRLLETVSGVVIYTLIAALLWPRRAGDQLLAFGATFSSAARAMLAATRVSLTGDDDAPDASGVEAKFAGAIAALTKTIPAASSDTHAVRIRRAEWAAVPARLQRLGTALELHRIAAGDVRAAGVAAYATAAEPVHDEIDRRLARIHALWSRVVLPTVSVDEPTDQPTDQNRDEAPLEIPTFAAEDLTVAGRLALASFSSKLSDLDEVTRMVARDVSALDTDSPRAAPPPDAARPLLEPRKLGFAMLPALCYLLGCMLWIVADPPNGSGVPEMAAIIGLATLNLPDRRLLRPTLVAIFKGLVCCVPVYFFVMPWLAGGPGILVVIFLFSALFAWLGTKQPALRFGAMLMFTMSTGIANGQTYSFLTFANLSAMMLLAFGCVFLVYGLAVPLRAEADISRSVRQFFATCARVLDGTSSASAAELAKPLAGALAAQKHLDPAAAPGNTPERVSQLLATMQSLSLRMAALESERVRWRDNERVADAAATEPLARAESQLQQGLDDLSLRQTCEPLDDVEGALDEAGRAFEESAGRESVAASRDGHAYLASTRGVLAVTRRAREAVAELDWDRWAAARF